MSSFLKIFILILVATSTSFGSSEQCIELFTSRLPGQNQDLFLDLKKGSIEDEETRNQISKNQLQSKYSTDLATKTDSSFWEAQSANLLSGLNEAAKKVRVGLRQWYDLQFPRYAGKWSTTEEYTRTYVRNITESVQQAFIPFLKSNNTSYNGFKKMLLKQNRILILGSNSEKPYGGFIAGQGWETSIRKMMDRLGLPLEERAQLIAEERVNVQSSAGRLRTLPVDIDMRSLIGKYGLLDYIRDTTLTEVPIKDVPQNAFPKNDFKTSAEYWSHEYPDPIDIEHYLKSMHGTYLQILKCGGCSRLRLIDLIAEYYHTGINAHIFPRGNQSLLMSHVNVFLMSMGLKGLKHASLYPLSLTMDMAALIMTPEAFKSFFRQEVISHHYFYVPEN